MLVPNYSQDVGAGPAAFSLLQEQLKRRLEESDYGDRANGSSYDCAPPGPKRSRGDGGGGGGPHGAHAGAPLSAPLRHPLPPHPQHARQHCAPLPAPSHGRYGGGGGGVQHCGTAVSVTHCVTGDRSRKTIHTTVTVLQDGGAGTALKVEPRDGAFCSVDDDLKRGGAPGCGVSSEVDQELEFILEELERELAKGDTKEAFDFGRPALNGDDERPAAVEEEEHKHFLKLEHGAARRCEDKAAAAAAALGTLVVKREMSPSCHGSAGAGSPLHAQGRTAPSPVVASPPSQQQPVQAARFPPQTAPPAHHHAHHNHIQQQQQHQQLGMNMSFASRLQAPMNYQGVPPFQQQAVARHVQQQQQHQQQQQGVKGQLPVQGGPSCGWPPSAPARGGPRSSPAYDADRPKVSASGHAMAPSRPGPTGHVAQPGRASPSPAGHAAQPNRTPPGAASQANHNHHRHHHQHPQQQAQHQQQQQHHLPVALPGQMPAPRGAEGVVSPGCGHPPGPPVPVNAAAGAGAATPPSQGGHAAPLGHKGGSAAAITRPHEACPNVTAGALSYGDTKPLTHFDPDGEEARGAAAAAAAAAGGGPPPAMPGAVAAPGSGGFYPHDAGARQPARARTAPEVRRLLLRHVLEQGGLGGGELAARIGAQYQPGAQEKVVGGLNLKPSPGPGFPGNRLAATLPGLNATEQKRELIHQQLMENQQLHRHLTRPPPEYKDQPMAVPANSYPATTQPFSMPIGSPVTQMSPVHCPGASQPPPPVYALPNGSPLHHHHQQQQQPSMMGIVPPPSPVVVATQQGTNMSGHGVRAVRSSVTPGAPVPVPVPVPVPGRLVHPAEPAAFRGQRAAAGHNVWGQQNQQGQQHPQQIQQQRFPLPNQAVNFPIRPPPAHLSTAPQAGLGQLNAAPGTPGQVPNFPPLHGEQGGGGGFFRVSGGCSNVAVESMGGAAGSGLASLNGGSDFVDSLLKGSGGGGGGSGSGGSNEDWQDLEEILGQN
ncbi:uncharacterized protein LOC116943485 isoform X2 [Petromyzon marinus]|uniref:uncharacterized protein LOC116943485 isoform X2 n=1 Tax=Petromyzon marinus TaxID=7757 RepID=UPI003F6F8B29